MHVANALHTDKAVPRQVHVDACDAVQLNEATQFERRVRRNGGKGSGWSWEDASGWPAYSAEHSHVLSQVIIKCCMPYRQVVQCRSSCYMRMTWFSPERGDAL